MLAAGETPLKLRVMTLNLGGGVKNFTGTPQSSAERAEALSELIRAINPDLLAVQEVAQYIDADGKLHSMIDQIRQAGQFVHSFYGETLSMKRHMQIKKDLMINGIFNDWWDWSKGNGLFAHFPFSRLGDTNKEGEPRNLPIFQPLSYEGTRDTDPRYVILSRIKQYPHPFVLNLHLTTLVGERGPNAWQDTINTAQFTRQQQMARVLGLLETHVLTPGLPLILLGDFNAKPDEYALKGMLEDERGFARLSPTVEHPTHTNAGAVDHIYFYPRNRLVSYTCEVIDSQLSHRVSDHLPVVAEMSIL